MKVTLPAFFGEKPILGNTKLQVGYASSAVNTKLSSMDLAAFDDIGNPFQLAKPAPIIAVYKSTGAVLQSSGWSPASSTATLSGTIATLQTPSTAYGEIAHATGAWYTEQSFADIAGTFIGTYWIGVQTATPPAPAVPCTMGFQFVGVPGSGYTLNFWNNTTYTLAQAAQITKGVVALAIDFTNAVARVAFNNQWWTGTALSASYTAAAAIPFTAGQLVLPYASNQGP